MMGIVHVCGLSKLTIYEPMHLLIYLFSLPGFLLAIIRLGPQPHIPPPTHFTWASGLDRSKWTGPLDQLHTPLEWAKLMGLG